MILFNLVLSPWALGLMLVGFVTYYYLYPYLFQFHHLLDTPAPFPAQFSNLWLLSVARRGTRSLTVDQVHKELGPVVRLQPNHVSIADDEAIPIIYGHRNGFLKSNFYDAFVSIRRGLFNTRDRHEHTRKRKLISHTYSAKSVIQFEPYVKANLALFVQKWDELVQTKPEAEGATIDCLKWFNYLSFDIIGDLAFGAPFGMLRAGADRAEVRESPVSPPIYASAIQILNRRGEVSAALGILPELKPWARYLPDPFFTQGLEAVQNLAGMAIAAVKSRIENPPATDRLDLLARLMEGRDDKGQPLGREELTAEALTQLIAGSDTTSNSSCAMLYHAARTPGVLDKLYAELDAAVPADCAVPAYNMVKDLPYLTMVINEALRHHSTSAMGLPREIPPESPGVTIRGHYFPPGSVLSVPSYTIHHSREIWGPDADLYRPERWLSLTPRQKNAFIPFGIGPRGCVGRNVAEMELKLIVATWARRYRVELRQDHMHVREGFLRKPMGLKVNIKRR